MSRSCPRVMSPAPARSTLITSAPNQARSWVQVGPDCTWVKSRMRTPSSALDMGDSLRGSPLPLWEGWGEGVARHGRWRFPPPPNLGPLRGPSPRGEGEDCGGFYL